MVYENVVYKEISQTICGNAHTYEEPVIEVVEFSKKHEQHGWNGENEEEGIVFLEETFTFLVVITMQVPQESMHYELMGAPGDAFHDEKGGENNQ